MINHKKSFNLFIIFYLFINNFCYSGVRSKINQGNKLYHQKKYSEALQKYQDGLIDHPQSKELHFNLGNANYKNENYEQAIKEYEKAIYSKDILLQSKSYYNIGNCLYRLGNLQESILYYKKALELNPDDKDAKYNIEFVQKKLKQQKNQQQKQQPNKQKQQNQQKQKQERMSKEDAQRLLKKFEEDEKQAQKQIRRRTVPVQVDEDW